MKIRYTKVALKYLNGLPKNLRESIRESVKGLIQTPPIGDVKIMQGYKDGRRRLRVGKFRVIYKYSEDIKKEEGIDVIVEILIVMEIGIRGDIYK